MSEAYADLPADAATDMVRFIAASLTLGEPEFKGEGTPLRAARLLAPIPSPRRDIMCVGKNYYEHAREFTASGYDSSAQSVAQAIPSAPIIFGKSADSVIASNDYEAELPTLIMRGQYDGIASFEDLIEFFTKLPNPNKQFTVMEGISHASFQQKNYKTVYAILHEFFARPDAVYQGD